MSSQFEDAAPTSPPHDLAAELAVLGAVLKNPSAYHDAAPLLTPAAFYDKRHRLIYAAMQFAVASDTPIDYHTLSAALQQLGTYDESGGLLYLSQIGLDTPSAAHIAHYARIVADHYTRRQTISTVQAIAEHAWRASQPVDDLLADAQSAIVDLSVVSNRAPNLPTGDAIGVWMDNFGISHGENKDGDRVVGHTTGLRCLDRITLGLRPGRLYTLPAYTGAGKSVIAQQVAQHVARHHGPVLLASLEMSPAELVERGIAMESGVPIERLATYNVTDAEHDRIKDTANRQALDPLYYADGSERRTTTEIWSRALQLQAQVKRPLALIVIDYGQLLADTRGERHSVVEDQTMISRNLKRMASALNVPLLVPVQINRQGSDRPPQLSDIRDSGSWEQDSDVVIGLYRPALHSDRPEHRGILELSVLKNRHAGQKPGDRFKAVFHNGRYWEWAQNAYTDTEQRTPIPPWAASAFDDDPSAD